MLRLKKPLERGKIKNFYLGLGSFSFVETKDNKLYGFGENTEGQLGLGDLDNRIIPTEVTPLRNLVKRVFLGRTHVFVESSVDRLFVFGKNTSGELCLSGTSISRRNVPFEIGMETLRGKLRNINLGWEYSFMETVDNELYVCGNNNKGQLGLNDNSNRFSPFSYDLSVLK